MVDVIYTAITNNNEDIDFLQNNIISEETLNKVADHIKKRDAYGSIFRLVNELPSHNHIFDWNVCSILQHFDIDLILETLQQFNDQRPLYESIGLASILGEYRKIDTRAIDYLHSVVNEARDAKA